MWINNNIFLGSLHPHRSPTSHITATPQDCMSRMNTITANAQCLILHWKVSQFTNLPPHYHQESRVISLPSTYFLSLLAVCTKEQMAGIPFLQFECVRAYSSLCFRAN